MIELTEQMDNVASEMAMLAARMLNSTDDEHKKHGDELYGAACVLHGWADYLRNKKTEADE